MSRSPNSLPIGLPPSGASPSPHRGNPSAFPRPPFNTKNLFLNFFVCGMFLTPRAVFVQIQLPLHQLLILTSRIINPLTIVAAKFDYAFAKFTLRHGICLPKENTIYPEKTQVSVLFSQSTATIYSPRPQNVRICEHFEDNKKPTKKVGLLYFFLQNWSQWSGLNRRPPPYHGGALPAELHWQKEQNRQKEEYYKHLPYSTIYC